MDLSNFSVAELDELRKQIDVEIKRRQQSEKSRLRAEIQRLAAESGLTIEEILGGKISGKKTVAPVYANPEDPSQTWSDRGRKPAWFIAVLAAGKTENDLKL